MCYDFYMTKYNHNIDEYIRLLNEGRTFREIAEITGNGTNDNINRWIHKNYTLEKKVIYRAIKKNW